MLRGKRALVVGLILLLGFLGYQFFSFTLLTQKLLRAVFNDWPVEFSQSYRAWQPRANFWLKISASWRKEESTVGRMLVERLPELLGVGQPQTYFVLLQNNRELRPSGGFMGSYAKLKFQDGGLRELLVQDIYVPDGQIPGHVEPPWPIQKAFKQGWWRLRDANWDADFSRTAPVIGWFLEKGGEERADGFIAVNLSLFKEIIELTGPLYLPDYRQVLDVNNFYEVIQSYAEVNFFPGSTQKKAILSAASQALWEGAKKIRGVKVLVLGRILYRSLADNETLLFFAKSSLQDSLQQLRWDGSIKPLEQDKKAVNDYSYLLETNLGANKANCCVYRRVVHSVNLVSSTPKRVVERVVVDYRNESPAHPPPKPLFWGGDYVNFLRLYLPGNASKVRAVVGGQEVAEGELWQEKREELGLIGVGFFVLVPVNSSRLVEISYELPVLATKTSDYRLDIYKQPGLGPFTYLFKLCLNSQSCLYREQTVVRDTQIAVPISYN